MWRAFSFVFTLAAVSVSVSVLAQEETECHKITPDPNYDLTEKGHLVYCKSAESNKFCKADIIPVPSETRKKDENVITYLDENDEQKTLTFKLEEQDKKGLFFYEGYNTFGTIPTVTDDKQCFVFLKCPVGKPAVAMVLCKKPEQCEDTKYEQWLSDYVKNTKGAAPVEKMTNQYQICHEKGVF